MSFWRDSEFQHNLLTFLCRDRNFLKKVSSLLEVDDFKPKKGESKELYVIAKLALEHWRQYEVPIGGMLRTEVLDACRQEKYPQKFKDKLLDAVDEIRKDGNLVAVEALEQKIIGYKSRRAKHQAIEELIELQESGKLDDAKFMRVLEDALRTFGHDYKVSDYLKGLEKRIRRRQIESQRKYPYLLIEPLDVAVRAIPRGTVGLVLAKWKKGKSLFLAWLSYAMAIQSYNTLYFTLEDPKSEIEDRLDGCLTGLSVRNLANLPNKLRRRYKSAQEKMQGRIKIVDGTDGGMSVQRMKDIFDKERNRGFVADVIIIDYDDEIVPDQKRTGDAARRMEFADIYRDLRKFASSKDVYLWTAAQAKRGKKSQMIVTGEDTAEDISKVRKVAMCIGIGDGPKEWGENSRHLHIAAHKFDKMKIGWNIMGDFQRGIFYSREMTDVMTRKTKKEDDDG